MLEAISEQETFFKVFGIRNRMNGTADIKAQNLDDFKKESGEFSKKRGAKSSIKSTEAELEKELADIIAAFNKKESGR